jgi:hypothetical protein
MESGPRARISGLAIASLVSAGLGAAPSLGLLGPLLAPVGLLLGVAALFRIRTSQGAVRGQWLAVAGVLLSFVGIGIGVGIGCH